MQVRRCSLPPGISRSVQHVQYVQQRANIRAQRFSLPPGISRSVALHGNVYHNFPDDSCSVPARRAPASGPNNEPQRHQKQDYTGHNDCRLLASLHGKPDVSQSAVNLEVTLRCPREVSTALHPPAELILQNRDSCQYCDTNPYRIISAGAIPANQPGCLSVATVRPLGYCVPKVNI